MKTALKPRESRELARLVFNAMRRAGQTYAQGVRDAAELGAMFPTLTRADHLAFVLPYLGAAERARFLAAARQLSAAEMVHA